MFVENDNEVSERLPFTAPLSLSGWSSQAPSLHRYKRVIETVRTVSEIIITMLMKRGLKLHNMTIICFFVASYERPGLSPTLLAQPTL